VLLTLSRLAIRLGCAVLVLHHNRKSDNKYRDSTAIGAGVDVILQMTESGESERSLWAKGRWQIEDCTVRLVGSDSRSFELVWPGRPLRERVVAHVLEHPGCSKRSVRGVGGRGKQVDAMVQDLLAEGVLVDTGTENKSALYVAEDPV
jgi:hypothetical protein